MHVPGGHGKFGFMERFYQSLQLQTSIWVCPCVCVCLRVLFNLSGIFPLEHFDTERVHLMWQQLGMPEKAVFCFFKFLCILQPAGSRDKLYVVPPAERPQSLSETWCRYAFVFSVLITARKKRLFYFLKPAKVPQRIGGMSSGFQRGIKKMLILASFAKR